jgi:hypothetical protein
MDSVYCPVCKQVTLWRRQIGVGHLIAFLATAWVPGAIFVALGWHPVSALLGPVVWLLALIPMRERCDRCGWSERPDREQVPEEHRQLADGGRALTKQERLQQIASD